LTLLQRASIQQPGDMRVRQPRQRLALAAKALRDDRMGDRAIEEFDGAATLEAAVRSGGEPHFAHSAAADQPFDLVSTDLPAGEVGV
jgi:hypothetical protein